MTTVASIDRSDPLYQRMLERLQVEAFKADAKIMMGWGELEDVLDLIWPEITRTAVQAKVAGEMLRDVLEAWCKHEGLSTNSDINPDCPARNYQLMIRLGCGEIAGIPNEKEIS